MLSEKVSIPVRPGIVAYGREYVCGNATAYYNEGGQLLEVEISGQVSPQVWDSILEVLNDPESVADAGVDLLGSPR